MKKTSVWLPVSVLAFVLATVCGLSGCKGTSAGFSRVEGTLDGPLKEDTVPSKVLEAIERAEHYHQHELMSDATANVAVFSIDEADTISTEGYGIVVTKDATSTTFPNIRNVRQPLARYDCETGKLWLTSSQMEGTGVAVERPYLIRFGDNDIAYIAATIDPYDMQQALCQRLCYSVDGREVALYDGEQHLVTTTVNETDMGDLYEDAVWIGEQLTYDIDAQGLTVCLVPGLCFNTGRVLIYDDMPTLKARVTLNDNGTFSLGDFRPHLPHPYEGTYLDEDINEPNLTVTYRQNDGKYDVQIGIFRLTELDDGVGTVGEEGLSFTATDAAGNPIGGVITLQGDTATVTFTRTTWELIEPGASFLYVRQRD